VRSLRSSLLTPFAPAVLASRAFVLATAPSIPTPTARQPHLTPPQPRQSPPLRSGDWLPRACCSAAMRPRRHAPPHW